MMGCAAISFTNTPAGATTITQVVVEDKGLVVPVIPAVHTFPSVDVVTVVSPPEIVSVTRIHPNSEIVFIPAGPPFELFNIFASVIEGPEPINFHLSTDIFWFMAANTGTGTGLFNALVSAWVSPKCHTLMQTAVG